MPLDEVTLRRPDFVEGEPVVLADGQTWQLRRPLVRFTPAETDSGFAVVLSLNNDPQYGALYRRYEAVEPGCPVMAESLALARAVLLANYDLTADQVGELLQFGASDDDPEGWRIREEVMAVCLGMGKERSGAGEE
jgi:hypothetical protein